MRDFPIFTTEYGVSSLTLKEIPYKKQAYIHIRQVQEGYFREHLEECVSFCRMCGAEAVFAAGHEALEGYPLLGSVEQASHDHPGAAVLIAVGDNATRERIYRTLRGHDFPVIVDPSAEVAPTADMRHGTFIGPKAVGK